MGVVGTPQTERLSPSASINGTSESVYIRGHPYVLVMGANHKERQTFQGSSTVDD